MLGPEVGAMFACYGVRTGVSGEREGLTLAPMKLDVMLPWGSCWRVVGELLEGCGKIGRDMYVCSDVLALMTQAHHRMIELSQLSSFTVAGLLHSRSPHLDLPSLSITPSLLPSPQPCPPPAPSSSRYRSYSRTKTTSPSSRTQRTS